MRDIRFDVIPALAVVSLVRSRVVDGVVEALLAAPWFSPSGFLLRDVATQSCQADHAVRSEALRLEVSQTESLAADDRKSSGQFDRHGATEEARARSQPCRR